MSRPWHNKWCYESDAARVDQMRPSGATARTRHARHTAYAHYTGLRVAMLLREPVSAEAIRLATCAAQSPFTLHSSQ